MRWINWLLATVMVCTVGCGRKTTAPLTKMEFFKDCNYAASGGTFIDPACFRAKADIYCRGPRHGLIMRQTVGARSQIIWLDPASGHQQTIVDSVWSECQPVWAANHPVISYDTGGQLSAIIDAWTDGTYKNASVSWNGRPYNAVTNPMFPIRPETLTYLFQWTGSYGDTSLTTIGDNGEGHGISLGVYGNPYHARMSADGRWVVCQSTTVPGIFLVNLSTQVVTRLTTTPGYEPALSSDGHQVVFLESKTDPDQIWLNNLIRADIQLDGSLGRRDTIERFDPHVGAASPVFSPDNGSIAWVFYPPGIYPETIQITDLSTRSDRHFTLPGVIAHLDWR